MKKITLWQRLNLALVLMILLLLGGFCVFFWTEKAGSESRRLVAELTNTKDKLRYDLAEADDAVRGILFDPKHELNSNRWRQANASSCNATGRTRRSSPWTSGSAATTTAAAR